MAYHTEILDLITSSLSVPIKSVIDIGCGDGSFSDGLYFDREEVEVKKCDINPQNDDVEKVDLSQPLNQEKRYDLCICTEVVEHIPETYSNAVIHNLTGLSDIILFSAAIPHQIAESHVNLKWPSFWQNLFEDKGYVCVDCIRPFIWEMQEIPFWYKQNLLLYIKEDKTELLRYNHFNTRKNLNLVHPQMLHNLLGGKYEP